MASLGQKLKKYSVETKKKILDSYYSYPKHKYKLDNTIQVAKEFAYLKIPKIKFDL